MQVTAAAGRERACVRDAEEHLEVSDAPVPQWSYRHETNPNRQSID
jgi:hypothetical protein